MVTMLHAMGFYYFSSSQLRFNCMKSGFQHGQYKVGDVYKPQLTNESFDFQAPSTASYCMQCLQLLCFKDMSTF